MKNFKLAQPRTLEQATALLSGTEGRAVLMAGGTDLLGEMKEGIRKPEVVVDLMGIPGLRGISRDKDGLHIGALTTVADLALDPEAGRLFPGLRQAAEVIASPQLRAMGTVGGNLCQRPRCWYYRAAETVCRKKGGSLCYAARGRNRYHAVLGGGLCHIVHPSDLAAMLSALDARVAIHSSRGVRTSPLSEFFVPPSASIRRENVLGDDEVLTEIIVPLPGAGGKSAYLKFKERGAWDFAVVSAAASGTVRGGTLRNLRLVLGGVAPLPWRLKRAEDLLGEGPLDEGRVRQASEEALKEARPLGENAYKVDLAATIAGRAVASLGD